MVAARASWGTAASREPTGLVEVLWEILLVRDFRAVSRIRPKGSGTGFVEKASWLRGMEISVSDLGAAKMRACSENRRSEV